MSVLVNSDGSIDRCDDPHTSFVSAAGRYYRLTGYARSARTAHPDVSVYIEIPKPDFCEVRSLRVLVLPSGSDDNG